MLMGCSRTCPSWNCPATGRPSAGIAGASDAAMAVITGVAAAAASGAIGVAAEPAPAGAVLVAVAVTVGTGDGVACAQYCPGGHGSFGSGSVASGFDEHAM